MSVQPPECRQGENTFATMQLPRPLSILYTYIDSFLSLCNRRAFLISIFKLIQAYGGGGQKTPPFRQIDLQPFPLSVCSGAFYVPWFDQGQHKCPVCSKTPCSWRLWFCKHTCFPLCSCRCNTWCPCWNLLILLLLASLLCCHPRFASVLTWGWHLLAIASLKFSRPCSPTRNALPFEDRQL